MRRRKAWGKVAWKLPNRIAIIQVTAGKCAPAARTQSSNAMNAAVKSRKPAKPVAVRNMSAKAKTAAKAFKGVQAKKTPAKLKGAKAVAIKRAVRGFYLG